MSAETEKARLAVISPKNEEYILGQHAPYVGSRDVQRIDDRETKSWNDIIFSDEVMRHWLEGKNISEIAKLVDSTHHLILKALSQRRSELRDIQNEEILNLSAERIEAFRDIKRRAILAMHMRPGQSPQLLTVALRAEEDIGKIQGVLNDKVIHLGRIEHVVKKLYDFEDSFPDQSESKVHQGEVVVIQGN